MLVIKGEQTIWIYMTKIIINITIIQLIRDIMNVQIKQIVEKNIGKMLEILWIFIVEIKKNHYIIIWFLIQQK